MDNRMPVMDGIEATRRIVGARLGTRVLILSRPRGFGHVARAGAPRWGPPVLPMDDASGDCCSTTDAGVPNGSCQTLATDELRTSAGP
jgi:hypothetical protein